MMSGKCRTVTPSELQMSPNICGPSPRPRSSLALTSQRSLGWRMLWLGQVSSRATSDAANQAPAASSVPESAGVVWMIEVSVWSLNDCLMRPRFIEAATKWDPSWKVHLRCDQDLMEKRVSEKVWRCSLNFEGSPSQWSRRFGRAIYEPV